MIQPNPAATLQRQLRLYKIKQLGDDLASQIQTFDSVPDVRGWFCGDLDGMVLFASISPTVEQRTLDAVAENISATFKDSGQFDADALTEIELRYGATHLIARRVGDVWFAVWCGARADLALVRLTLNVATPTLAKDCTLQAALAAH